MKHYTFNGSIRTLAREWLADTGYAKSQENIERVSASLDKQPFMPTSLYVGTDIPFPETYTVEDLHKTSGTPTTTTTTTTRPYTTDTTDTTDTQEKTPGTPTSTYYNAGTQQNEPMDIVDRTSSTPKVTTTTRPYTRQNDTTDTVKNG